MGHTQQEPTAHHAQKSALSSENQVTPLLAPPQTGQRQMRTVRRKTPQT
jgi:hypothetical protein